MKNKTIIPTIIHITMLASSNSFATISGKFLLNHIEDAFNKSHQIIEQSPSCVPVVIWDIDDTLLRLRSRFDGQKEQFVDWVEPREGKKTEEVVKKFQEIKCKKLVITARNDGRSLNDEKTIIIIKKTLEDLKSIKTLDLTTHGAIEDSLPQQLRADGYPIVFAGSLVFAGPDGEAKKAKVAEHIIDNGIMKNLVPTHLIIIDDNLSQLKRYEEVFANRSEYVYLFHYFKEDIILSNKNVKNPSYEEIK